jgi:hypothetical protein
VRRSLDSNSGSALGKMVPKADASARESYMDTKMRSTGVNWNRTSLHSPQKQSARLFTKTVTNFNQVKYDNNGGLNPQSPYKRVFKKYSAFKSEFDTEASKADYKHFLAKVVKDTQFYDSNIGNSLSHQKKFLAYKNRELSQRASALHGNA